MAARANTLARPAPDNPIQHHLAGFNDTRSANEIRETNHEMMSTFVQLR